MLDASLIHEALSEDFAFRSAPYSNTDRLSRPAPGRSLGATVTRAEVPVRESVSLLSRGFIVDSEIFEYVFDCTIYGPGGYRDPDNIRLSWFVICVSLVQALIFRRSQVRPFLQALEWFFDDSNMAHRMMTCFSQKQVAAAEQQLKALSVTREFYDLFPYIVEPHGHVTRNRLKSCDIAKRTRNVKKGSGVYYTPSDIAEFMVASLAELPSNPSSWFDPACGTGVFLRAVVAQQLKSSPKNDPFQFAISGMFGIDKSALATDLAAFTVLIECAGSTLIKKDCFQRWRRIKENIVCMDALRLSPSDIPTNLLQNPKHAISIQKVFPNIGSNGFDRIIMNPPYASTKIDKTLQSIWHSYSGIRVGQSGDLHLAFTEMLWRFSTNNGAAAAVLPLSVGTNTTRSYLQLRQKLLASPGAKEFLFFDREPQALFGEDIKTRNLILFQQSSPVIAEVRTSRLLKWTAKQRPEIFSRNRLVTVDPAVSMVFIPKLGTDQEMLAYSHLQSFCTPERGAQLAPSCSRLTLEKAIHADDPLRRKTLIVASTAYNFINCYFANALPNNPSRPYSSNPANALQFHSEEDSYAAYALVSSRLCFWLWHVEGDGFHLTSDFLKRMPLWAAFGSKLAKQRLSEHGWHLWDKAKNLMVGAVNGGKQTYSFHYGYDSDAAISTEREIFSCLGLDPQFSNALDAFIEATVSIDGKNRLRHTDLKLRKVV